MQKCKKHVEKVQTFPAATELQASAAAATAATAAAPWPLPCMAAPLRGRRSGHGRTLNYLNLFRYLGVYWDRPSMGEDGERHGKTHKRYVVRAKTRSMQRISRRQLGERWGWEEERQ